MKFNPNQTEIRAKKSSLAIEILEDSENGFEFYVFNRRTKNLISLYRIPLIEHCRKSMLHIEPIPKRRKVK